MAAAEEEEEGEAAEEQEQEQMEGQGQGQGQGQAEENGNGNGNDNNDEKVCFPEEVLEHVLAFVTDRRDRNAVSLVCWAWHRVEGGTRETVFIGNCYALSPETVARRFPRARSVVLKGKPRFADFNLVPPNWGAHLRPWVSAFAADFRCLERLHLKRMCIADDDLSTIASSLPLFSDLQMLYCDGFSTGGLAAVAARCRRLTRLDLNEDDIIDDNKVDWLGSFPETTTGLVCLNFECLEGPVNFRALERLVERNTGLKELRLNKSVTIAQLHRLMLKAPQLTHLGTGCFSYDYTPEQATVLQLAFNKCKHIQCLSGFRDVVPEYLPTIYSSCINLTDLNLSYAEIRSEELEQLVQYCSKLQRLWVMDSVGDVGLRAAAATCKDLRDVRVFPIDAREDAHGSVSDQGLIAISEGCPKLESILYFCQRMTNAAVITMSRNCPNLASFRLCIMGRHTPDHITGEPMDEGFGAIVMNCKKLKRLAVSGLLTDRSFEYIGRYGKSLETLSVAFAGESDVGMEHVLRGCKQLRKLEIRDSPFGDVALLSGIHQYQNMRFLWMSDCPVTLEGCREVATRMRWLNVEIMNENELFSSESHVEKLYVYRTIAGPRTDMPRFVVNLR